MSRWDKIPKSFIDRIKKDYPDIWCLEEVWLDGWATYIFHHSCNILTYSAIQNADPKQAQKTYEIHMVTKLMEMLEHMT